MVKILLVLLLVSSKVFADKITCIAEDYQECEWGGVSSLQCKEGKKYSADNYGLNHSMSKFTMYSYSEYKKPTLPAQINNVKLDGYIIFDFPAEYILGQKHFYQFRYNSPKGYILHNREGLEKTKYIDFSPINGSHKDSFIFLEIFTYHRANGNGKLIRMTSGNCT